MKILLGMLLSFCFLSGGFVGGWVTRGEADKAVKNVSQNMTLVNWLIKEGLK